MGVEDGEGVGGATLTGGAGTGEVTTLIGEGLDAGAGKRGPFCAPAGGGGFGPPAEPGPALEPAAPGPGGRGPGVFAPGAGGKGGAGDGLFSTNNPVLSLVIWSTVVFVIR